MDVVIELKSSVASDGDETMSLNALGSMVWEGSRCQLSCEILDEDGDPIVMTITADGDDVVVEQCGSRRSRLSIRAGERVVSPYETPYGALLLGVTGLDVENALTPEGGTLALTYVVDVNASDVSTNIIEIRVRRTSSDVEPC